MQAYMIIFFHVGENHPDFDRPRPCTTRPRAVKKPRLRLALFDITENQQHVFLLLRHTQERLLLIQLCIPKIDFYASL